MSYSASTPRHAPSSPHQGASDAAAALKGASLAFSKTSNKPKPLPPPKSSYLSAATSSTTAPANSVRGRSRSRSPALPLSRQTTGNGSVSGESLERDGSLERGDIRDRLARQAAASTRGSGSRAGSHVHLPLAQGGNGHQLSSSHDSKNTSYIAAALAASRSASPAQPNGPGHQAASAPPLRVAAVTASRLRRTSRSSLGSTSASASSSNTDLPDTRSIAPATSLISLFEERPSKGDEANVDPIKSPVATVRRIGTDRPKPKPKIRPMTPERPISPKRPADAGIMDTASGSVATEPSPPLSNTATPQAKPKPKPKLKPKPSVASLPSEEHVAPIAMAQASRPSAQSSEVSRRLESTGQPVRRPTSKPIEVQAKKLSAMPQQTSVSSKALESRPDSAPISKAPSSPNPPEKPKALRPPDTRGNSPALSPVSMPTTRQNRSGPLQIPQPRIVSRSSPEVVSPKPTRPTKQPQLPPPTPPQPRGSKAKTPSSTVKSEGQQSVMSTASENSMATLKGDEPDISARPPTSGTNDTSSSNDSFVSASSTQTPIPSPTRLPSSPGRQSERGQPSTMKRSNSTSTRPPASSRPRRSGTASSANMDLNSLSNAIMAGSLAASRLTPSNTGTSTPSSGVRPPALPTRTKSPRLRQTLRRQPVVGSEDEEARRIRKHHGHHTHSNKSHFHHEGARRRWREEISLNERRRYEALWASNKGLLLGYMPPASTSSTETLHLPTAKTKALNGPSPATAALQADLSDYVLNVVVRELWRRSRLPDDELVEVWNLVDPHRDRSERTTLSLPPPGMLGKQEFVVGTWIIDQRLRGRKIPARVSSSVWDSAKGVKVWTPKN